MGSCVPRHVMSAALAPHCWNATSFADPEYVIDFTSPNAFCALAIVVFASWPMAIPLRNPRHIANTAIFLNTVSPLIDVCLLRRNTTILNILYPESPPRGLGRLAVCYTSGR